MDQEELIVEKEIENFVNASKEIQALLDCGPLRTVDRTMIISTAYELLTRLKA